MQDRVNVVIFGGTTEGRILSALLMAEGMQVQVFVATEYGGEEQRRAEGNSMLPDHAALPVIHVGRKTADEIQRAVKGTDLCVDATHPYAVQVTENIRTACERTGIPYYRLKRSEGWLTDEEMSSSNIVMAASAQEAAIWLSDRDGNILLTTGSKELEQYKELGADRLYPRVLPLHDSIEACEKAGIPHRNIIAMQGPFGQELNEAIIRQFRIAWLVTKESGRIGGFMEKIRAAEACGIRSLVIARPDEEGYTMEEIYEICRRSMV